MTATGALLDRREDFGPFEGRHWLNCAHQGPLPRVAADAARQALAMKVAPHHLLDSTRFTDVPAALREAIGLLIGVPADDVILGNSATYGMTLLVNGLSWKPGDEVLLVRGDFPATIYPWLPLAERGVTLRYVEPQGPHLTPQELQEHLSPATRLFCTNWVHSFTGCALDERALARVCRDRGVLFVLNASQGIGQRPFDAPASGVDAVTSCGFKWLLGPYGTGFCWIRPEVRGQLRTIQGYWLANLTADDLQGDFTVRLRDDLGARRFDVFGTANFLNFMTWTASLRYLLAIGIGRAAAHDQALVDRLLQGLDRDRYTLVSPASGPARTAIVVLRRPDAQQTRATHARLHRQGVDVALRRGALRVAPHVHNAVEDIEALLARL